MAGRRAGSWVIRVELAMFLTSCNIQESWLWNLNGTPLRYSVVALCHGYPIVLDPFHTLQVARVEDGYQRRGRLGYII